MGKLRYEDKIQLYNDWRNGISVINLVKKYNINKSTVVYLTRIVVSMVLTLLEKTKIIIMMFMKKKEL